MVPSYIDESRGRGTRGCFPRSGKLVNVFARDLWRSLGLLSILLVFGLAAVPLRALNRGTNAYMQFLTRRDDMLAALSKAGSTLTVTLLLDTLRQTLEFEQGMSTKFRAPVCCVSIHRQTQILNPFCLELIVHLDNPGLVCTRSQVTLISLRRIYGHLRRRTGQVRTFPIRLFVVQVAQTSLYRALSDMISAYRGPKSRSSLTLEESSSSTDASSPGGASSPPVLASSTDLFYFYGQNLEQCAKLSIKGPLFDLAGVYKKWLRIYAGELHLFLNVRGGYKC